MIFRVLSIDFDYFQNVSLATMTYCYPDPIDLDPKTSEIVWSLHYADKHMRSTIKSIGIRDKDYQFMMDFLLDKPLDKKIMVSYTHKDIYDFIRSNITLSDEDTLEIINVDMHPDFTNNSSGLDCGNWLGYLKSELQDALVIKWIAPTKTFSVGFTEQDSQLYVGDVTYLRGTSVSDFDLIFLCRSDNWFAPHLDNYFIGMCNLLRSKSNTGLMQVGIDKPRTIHSINLSAIDSSN